MNTLDLSTQTTVQLAILEAEEQQHIKNITNILSEIDKMCRERAGVSLDTLIINYDNCIDRLDAINKEQQCRNKTSSVYGMHS